MSGERLEQDDNIILPSNRSLRSRGENITSAHRRPVLAPQLYAMSRDQRALLYGLLRRLNQ